MSSEADRVKDTEQKPKAKRYKSKEIEEHDRLLGIESIHSVSLDLSESISMQSKEAKSRLSEEPLIAAKKKKKRIREIRSCSDLLKWYFQSPVQRIPALYFFASFLLSFLFIITWYMDDDTTFIVCGLAGLVLSVYAGWKFKLLIALKYQVDKYKSLNARFRRERIKFEAEVDRARLAVAILKKTRSRLSNANSANRENLNKFQEVENNMKLIGERTGKQMTRLYQSALAIRRRWREEFIGNERNMLQAVYSRFERKHSNRSTLGMTKGDYDEFRLMVPRGYQCRFNESAFEMLAADDTLIDFQTFAAALDVFAEMEVDQMDIESAPRHFRNQAQSFSIDHFSK